MDTETGGMSRNWRSGAEGRSVSPEEIFVHTSGVSFVQTAKHETPMVPSAAFAVRGFARCPGAVLSGAGARPRRGRHLCGIPRQSAGCLVATGLRGCAL